MVRVPASRWYSEQSSKDAAEQNQGEAKEAVQAEPKDGGEVSEAEEALRKQLEAKEKEAIDWKVCIAPSAILSL